MQINLSDYDLSDFYVNSGVFCGIPALLVTPKQMGVAWDYKNEIFRSSIWGTAGNLLSASYKKFVNWEEKPEFHPAPKSLKGAELMEKLDGSTLVADYVNGQLSMRTRGTFSYITLDNGTDFMEAANKYPGIEKCLARHPNVSLLFEIVTPNNRIVINYGDAVDIYLIGAVNKDDYTYFSQFALDILADTYGFKRPARYSFDNVEAMCAAVAAFEGKEGICVYYNGGQSIRKVKAAKYLILHRMKSELSGMTNIVDLYIAQGCPDFNTLYKYVTDTFDFELAEQCRGSLSRICDAMKEVNAILAHMKGFVASRLDGLTRAQQAKIVIDAYGQTNRAGYVFKMLDGKEIDGDGIKKLLLQVLK